ncbi:capsule assembly Wzi family protein [Rheinheimera salexigens]
MIRLISFSCCLFIAALYSCQLFASPWVNTDDRYLRTSIKLLADAGYINIPINTYPLMWQPILAELAQANTKHMNQAQLFAFLRVTSALNYVRSDHIENLSLSASSDSLTPLGFGSRYAHRGQLSLGTELKGNDWAVGIQKSFNHESYTFNNINGIDYTPNQDWQGSYAAYTLGNWVLSASQQHQWWGPGLDSSFNYSNKGPAAKIIRLNRLNSALPLTDYLSILGPANITLEYGQQPGSALLRHHQFTAARLSIKPWQALEISSSISHQQGLTDEVLLRLNLPTFTEANTDSQTIANIDFRYSYNPNGAIYGALSHVANENGYLVGTEYNIANQQHQINLSAEYQWLAADYPNWLINAAAEAMHTPTEQLVLAAQWYRSDGQAGYVHFKQQRYAEVTGIKLSSAIQVGYQHELFKGLISLDYQLARQQASDNAINRNNISFAHEAGIRWEWRW